MDKTVKKQGVIAGISLIIMAIAAGFSYGYVHSSLVDDSAIITYKNLISNKSLFFAGLFSWTIIFITDLIVAIALFYYFRKTDRRVSLITALIRIVYTLILGFAILQLFKIIPIISSDKLLINSFKINEVTSHLQNFERTWSQGLIVFGFHLIGLGYLSVKSSSVNRLLGYLLYLGGISYILIHTAQQISLVNTNVINTAEKLLSLPMALAEILLAFWLIYKGFKK